MARNFVRTTPDRVEIGDPAAVDIAGTTMTVHCWVRDSGGLNAGDSTTEHRLISKYTSDLQYLLRISNLQKLTFAIGDGIGGTDIFTSTANVPSVDGTTWMALGGRKNGTSGVGSISTFINGTKEDGTSTKTIAASTDPLVLGSGFLSGTYQRALNGRLAEVAIWDAALSDSEMVALSRGAPALWFRPANLKGYWLTPRDGSPEPDFSGNGNTGTVTGATVAAHAPVGLAFAGNDMKYEIPTVVAAQASILRPAMVI